MQSSAKRQLEEQMSLSVSLMYSKNIRGAKTVPCGTPDGVLLSLDLSPLTIYNFLGSGSKPCGYQLM